MTAYKYTLERYQGTKTKHICPQCNKKTLTRYIDTENSEYLSDIVGRCDREDNCGYHYKPAQYFQDSGDGARKDVFRGSLPSLPTLKIYIPLEILKKSRTAYHKNTFVRHLSTLFDDATVNRLISAYHIGTSDGCWQGACVFWFIDHHGHIHAGQVKLFENGHTATYEADGEKKKCTTWIHSILKRKLSSIPSWLAQYDEQEKKVGCIFGEHLVKTSAKPFAVVEAPATAIVASAYLPQYTWLAAGSLSYLTAQRCEVLKGKKVVLYPDLGAYNKWKAKADEIGFDCSSLLEDNATDEDKAKGLDLRDYLERFNVSDFIKPNIGQKIVQGQTVPYTETLKDGRQILMHPAGYPMDWDIKREPLTQALEPEPHIEQLTAIPWDDIHGKPLFHPHLTVEQFRANGWRHPPSQTPEDYQNYVKDFKAKTA